MMYNRYVPDAAGVYRQTTVETVPDAPDTPQMPMQPPACPAPPPPPPPVPAAEPARRSLSGLLERFLPRGMDMGDLLVLLILILLAVDGEEEDSLSVILTIAAFLLS